MQHKKILFVLFILLFSIIVTALPVSADCTPSDGTGGNDSILCDSSNMIIGSISGRAGNDTITVNPAGGDASDDVYGDNSSVTGDDYLVIDSVANDIIGDEDSDGTDSTDHIGGDDTIDIRDDAIVDLVIGDNLRQDGGDTIPAGGNDSILVRVLGEVNEDIWGDFLRGGTSGGGGLGGNDTIIVSGYVYDNVMGDYSVSLLFSDGPEADGGNDFIRVNGIGAVYDNIYGDFVTDDGGHDTFDITGSVGGSIYGDYMFDNPADCCFLTGGNDSFDINDFGTVSGSLYGDYMVAGDADLGSGGDDYFSIDSTSIVSGNVIGDDLLGKDSLGGKDTILIHGTVGGYVSGDNDAFDARSRRDTITVYSTGIVGGSLSGDRTKKAGSKDTITVDGTVEQTVFGDNTNRAGADDSITIGGLVKKNVIGDHIKTIRGGKDTIEISGTVNKNVWGDGARTTVKPDVDGGDDTILVLSGGLVKGDVVGDNMPNDGGDDSIDIAGTVNGDVIGDGVGGKGGIDTIRVLSGGLVKGDVIGDGAGVPATPNNGGGDVFSIVGVVQGTVWLDNVGGPTLDVAGDASGVDLAVGGSDLIYVAGEITGNISSASGNDGDDIFVIADGGIVGGIMDAGAHIDGDSLIFDLTTQSKGEFGKLSALFDGLSIEDGTVRYRGNRYNWVNFEFLQYAVQLLQTRYIEPRCGGIYELNEAGTGCQRKGVEEYDAIMFHRNNPGYDGRMPGTEACAIYNYGNAMRVYEVVDGSEGELVTTISADVFSHNIESNLLLASSASGNVHVYYLTSNEVQVECTDWTGKTQVRIIPDFSGTVNASFDKERG